MQIKSSITRALFIVISCLFYVDIAMARTDTEAQTNFAKALAKTREQEMDHSQHQQRDKNADFHGVFYGYLPCNDCDGIKTTLSLKQNNNYLMVTQPARDSSREFYEKGKYDWNEETRIVTLTPRNKPEEKRYFFIKDEGSLVKMNDDGTRMSEELEDEYILNNSENSKNREVHIH